MNPFVFIKALAWCFLVTSLARSDTSFVSFITTVDLDINRKSAGTGYSYSKDDNTNTISFETKSGYGFGKVKMGRIDVWKSQTLQEYATKVTMDSISTLRNIKKISIHFYNGKVKKFEKKDEKWTEVSSKPTQDTVDKNNEDKSQPLQHSHPDSTSEITPAVSSSEGYIDELGPQPDGPSLSSDAEQTNKSQEASESNGYKDSGSSSSERNHQEENDQNKGNQGSEDPITQDESGGTPNPGGDQSSKDPDTYTESDPSSTPIGNDGEYQKFEHSKTSDDQSTQKSEESSVSKDQYNQCLHDCALIPPSSS